jgi:hypothetical protein
MKKIVFSILSICGLLYLTSCDYGSILYLDLDDTISTTYVVTSVKKLGGNTYEKEKENTAEYKASNKYGHKLIIKANSDNLSYGDTIIITKKQ